VGTAPKSDSVWGDANVKTNLEGNLWLATGLFELALLLNDSCLQPVALLLSWVVYIVFGVVNPVLLALAILPFGWPVPYSFLS